MTPRKEARTGAERDENPQPSHLDEVDFAGSCVVVEQSVKGSVVAVAVSRAHGRTRLGGTQKGPMLANTTKTAESFSINL